jgi:chromosome segregation ATPase
MKSLKSIAKISSRVAIVLLGLQSLQSRAAVASVELLPSKSVARTTASMEQTLANASEAMSRIEVTKNDKKENSTVSSDLDSNIDESISDNQEQIDSQKKLNLLNKKTDELELTQEVDELEKFGDAALTQETKKENKRIDRQNVQLERQIKMHNYMAERAKMKKEKLLGVYKSKDKVLSEVKSRARVAELQKNRSEKSTAIIRAKVEQMNQKIISELQKRKSAEMRLNELKNENQSLEKRLKRNQKNLKNIRAQNIYLNRRISSLERRNNQIASKVGRLDRRSVSREVVKSDDVVERL